MSKSTELAKKCGLYTNDYFVWSPGSQSVSVEHLEMVVQAARAEALMEAAACCEGLASGFYEHAKPPYLACAERLRAMAGNPLPTK